MKNDEQKKCQCIVTNQGRYSFSNSSKCSRIAKGKLSDGTPACGLHLRAEKMRIESKARFSEKSELNYAMEKKVKTVSEHYPSLKIRCMYDDLKNVMVDFEALLSVINGD